MKLYINIDRALDHYRRTTKKRMTKLQLGKQVFKKDRLSDSSINVYMSQWNSGKMLERCRVENLMTISRITGLSLSELITQQ